MAWLTHNGVLRVRLHLLGLSYNTRCKWLNALQVALSALLLGVQLKEMWYMPEALTATLDMGLMVLIDETILCAYQILYVFLLLQAFAQRKSELKIANLLEDIDNELQLKLYYIPEVATWRCSFRCVFNSMAFAIDTLVVALLLYLMLAQDFSLKTFGTVTAIHALRSKYHQYSQMVIAVAKRLSILEQVMLVNLQPEIKGQQHGRPEQGEPRGVYLLDRIVAMKSIYSQINAIILEMHRLYGVSIVLMDVVCICDFTTISYWYVKNPTIDEGFVFWLLLDSGYFLLPSLWAIARLSSLCDKCSRKYKRLMVRLNSCWPSSRWGDGPAYSAFSQVDMLLEEFTLQMMQTPIEFTAGRCYKLSLLTLTVILIFVIELLVLLLQFSRLVKE